MASAALEGDPVCLQLGMLLLDGDTRLGDEAGRDTGDAAAREQEQQRPGEVNLIDEFRVRN